MDTLSRTTSDNRVAITDWELVLIGWKEALSNQGRSKATLELYTGTVRQFFEHLGERMGLAIELENVTREHVQHYLSWVRETAAPATQRIRFIALRRYFKYATEVADVPMRQPMAKLAAPSLPERVVPAPSRDEIRAALATCDTKTLLGARDATLIRFLADSGLRVGEAMSLNVGSLDLASGIFRIIGKGDRERFARIGSQTRQAMSRYLRLAGKHRPNTSDAPLWISNKGGRRLTPEAALRAIRAAGKRAGITLRPHLLRHYFGTAMSEDVPEEAVMTLLGHRTSQMTRHYAASRRAERALKWHEQRSPGDRL